MEPPHQLRTAAADEDEVTITRRNYEDEELIAIDFGPGAEAQLDVVGDLAIVVAGDEQYEFEIPSEATDISTNDGILQIKA